MCHVVQPHHGEGHGRHPVVGSRRGEVGREPHLNLGWPGLASLRRGLSRSPLVVLLQCLGVGHRDPRKGQRFTNVSLFHYTEQRRRVQQLRWVGGLQHPFLHHLLHRRRHDRLEVVTVWVVAAIRPRRRASSLPTILLLTAVGPIAAVGSNSIPAPAVPTLMYIGLVPSAAVVRALVLHQPVAVGDQGQKVLEVASLTPRAHRARVGPSPRLGLQPELGLRKRLAAVSQHCGLHHVRSGSSVRLVDAWHWLGGLPPSPLSHAAFHRRGRVIALRSREERDHLLS